MKILSNGTGYILCIYFLKENILESKMRIFSFPFNQIYVFSFLLESDKKKKNISGYESKRCEGLSER